jgi:hypothetical protein
MLRAGGQASLSLACEASKTCENGQPCSSRDPAQTLRGFENVPRFQFPLDEFTALLTTNGELRDLILGQIKGGSPENILFLLILDLPSVSSLILDPLLRLLNFAI